MKGSFYSAVVRAVMAATFLYLTACSGSGDSSNDSPSAPAIPPAETPADPAPVDPPPVVAPEKAAFTTFESGQVRPIVLSADRIRLYALNTPDNRLEIFRTTDAGLSHLESVDVGMEPVALALRNGELWVVNHLSDSVSIVDVSQNPARVVRTLLVGDEPRDIVFAGSNGDRAFITAAHRGQNAPFDPQLKTASVGRTDVWVFDANNLGAAVGGTPLEIVNMFGDTARALAVSADGLRVYAAVLNSGNQTTTLFGAPRQGGLDKAPPLASADGATAPRNGLIVRFDGTDWMDSGDPVTGTAAKNWNDRVRFSLPDNDVFAIDAGANPPRQLSAVSGVGTTLFNMVVNPANNKLYVSNLEARNEVRFEGEGSTSTTVRGHFTENRITVIDGNNVAPRHLNKHISSYDQALGTVEENANSLAMPLQMIVSEDGKTLYVAAFSSAKVGVFNTAQIEDNSFAPNNADYISLSAGGPSGVALDEAKQRLYVLTRFDNGISVVDTETRREISHVQIYNPEPDIVVEGRQFLYDAALTSSRGDSSCASCHIFGDVDHLAWDLGDPDGKVEDNPRAYALDVGKIPMFHPMKGPMTTQSFRGMRGNGPMHWRGDRTGVSANADETLEEQAFEDFNVAFVGLLGRAEELSEQQMDAFAKYALQITYPPSPIRNLDNSLTAAQADGENTYFNVLTTGGALFRCNKCHELDPLQGKFGTGGLMSVEGSNIAEDFKVPHIRNAYQKVGMFGSTNHANDGRPQMGPQIRGFGYLHDGAVDTLTTFFSGSSSTLGGAGFVFSSEQAKQNVIDFVYAVDSDLAPIVGQQVTLSAANSGDSALNARLELMLQRAQVSAPRPECDLIAKGVIEGEQRGAVLNGDAQFTVDRANAEPVTPAQLKSTARSGANVITFTCVPPGNGIRMGVDRDLDGAFDADETDAGTDAANALSKPT